MGNSLSILPVDIASYDVVDVSGPARWPLSVEQWRFPTLETFVLVSLKN